MRKTPYLTLSRAYIIALSFIALLSLLAYLTLDQLIKTQETSARVVNVSGRQRMLSQRTALLATLLVTQASQSEREPVREQLRSTLALLEQSHQGLIFGDDSNGLPGKPSVALQAIYFKGTF